ncbi:MAG TPA: ATP synthase F1 subunit delta [Candidatus Gastranaerophilales bacterium]|nr:ATP synthase F1 subunit delta [Candidatus Gastranaerophilales bacterium]
MSETGKLGISIIADKYAIAMFELAETHDLLDNINSDLFLVKNIISTSNDLRNFIDHPLINSADKKDALEKIFAESVSLYSLNLIRLLTDRNRLFILPFIADYYQKILYKKRNMDIAQVITAIPVDENVLVRTREKLENLFKKRIKIESMVDKDLIAGMIIKIGDKIIDGSIKTKLENMKKQLC